MRYEQDEKLSSAIFYNFTKTYGDHHLVTLYDLVLPFMFHHIFAEEINRHDSFEKTIYACDARDPQFRADMLEALEQKHPLTEGALAYGMVHDIIHFDVSDEGLTASINPAAVPYISEAARFGEMIKGWSKDDVTAFLKKNRRMKIVVLQSASLGEDITMDFDNLGQVSYYPYVSQDQVIDLIQDADIVITNKNVIGPREMDAAKQLKMIGVMATGYNNIDVDYAKSKSIKVTNVKGYSTESVAQLTLAMALELLTHLRRYDWCVKSREYEEAGSFSYFPYPFHEFSTLTWGIVGMGVIGHKVASLAEALGFQVIYYSTSGVNHDSDYQQVDFDTLLTTSDLISIHAPLNDHTEHLFDREAFQKMKETAYLINAGRGPIVDEKALVEAIDASEIAGAGLDVFEEEPLSSHSALYKIVDPGKLILTPHVGWAAVEARERLLHEVYLNIEAFLHGESRNIVNGD